ncbi:MAG TPA: CHAT domain-containing tetratricopeptide repeat protein [Thermoanaerobaculia bacterium]|nr:CHAT domain-containing tetratricopeptide repeat protein [Thermoanaerobaculia bacterium]
MSRLLLPSSTPGFGVARGALCWALAALLAQACAAPRGGPSSPGAERAAAVTEHEIGPGESRPLVIELRAGQFVRAVVEQAGADVEVELLDPSAESVQKVDSPYGRNGLEDLAAVARRPGSHQIVVRSGERSDTGRYRIRIEGPRAPSEKDRHRAEAVSLTQRAVNLMGGRSPEAALREQVRLREQALPLWIQAGDRQREADTLFQLGTAHLALRENEEAVRYLHRASQLFEELDATVDLARTLNQAGRVDSALDRFQHAREHWEKALPLARRSGDRRLLFDISSNLGTFHINELGEPRTAIEVYLEEALGLAESVDRLAQTKAHINLGSAYADLSEYEIALEHSGRALQLARTLAGPDREVEEVTALNNLGDTYFALGELEKASQHFRQVLEHEGVEPLKRAKTLQNLGVALDMSGKTDEALRAFEGALDLARLIEDKDLQAYILLNRGNLHLGEREYQRALEAGRQALTLASRPETRARTLHILGASHRNLENLPAAREALSQALDLSQADLALRADITMVLAKVEKDAGELEKAGELAGQAIEAIEQLRDRVVRQDLRETFLASKQGFYEFYVDILMELERRNPGRGFAGRALDMNERARARGLLDLLAEVEADLSRDADAGLLAQERALRAEINALYQHRLKLIKDGVTGQRLEQVGDRLDEAIEKLYRVTADLKASSPHYAALARPEPLTSAQIQEKVLDRDSALLEYALGEDRSWLWVVRPDSIHTFELPKRAQVEKEAREYHGQVSLQPPDEEAGRNKADRAARRAGEALSRMLLEKAEPLLRGRRLLVVSDGALHYVPFGALPLPSLRKGSPSPLLDHNEVVYLPSASTLAVLREDEAKRRRPDKVVAAFGDPVFQERDDRLRRLRGDLATQSRAAGSEHRGFGSRADSFDPSTLPRLRFTQEEVNAIVEFADPERSFKALGFDATLAEVTSGRLAEYRIVHFATHGHIATDKPELSGLVFSRFDGRAEPLEGVLRLTDVYSLRLNADLVTLSACETALGQEMRGEGLIGLTRGFMYAGSSRVLATLWKVDDRTTMKLMKRFYEAYLREGQPAPAALRQAQREIRKDPWRRHPYYWAGFSLQGESR